MIMNSHIYRALLATAAALPFGISNAALVPSTVNIDPDGGAAGQSAIAIEALDWGQNSTLTVANIPLLPTDIGSIFTILTQATLGNFQNPSGVNLIGTGLNTDYEWTVVIAFEEKVQNLLDTTSNGFLDLATFQTVPGAATSELVIYYDTAVNANPLLGTGYNDGTVVLRADLSSVTNGNFQVDESSLPLPLGGTTGPVDLDQSGANNWPGTTTLVGNGSTGNLTFTVSAVDNAFFPDVFAGSIINMDMLFGNVSQQLPFAQVDPAQQLWDPVNNVFVASAVGAINGLNGPNELIQTDFNASFLTETVPAPGSLVLVGIGLAALGGGSLRRRRALTA
jgi:hypothetical protein